MLSTMKELKNLIYIAFCDSSLGGVEQKLLGQYDALELANAPVQLLLIAHKEPNDDFKKEIEKRKKVIYLITPNAGNLISRRINKFNIIKKHLNSFNVNDTRIYFRFPGAEPFSYLFYKWLKKKKFIVVSEHQQIENPYRNFNFLPGYFKLAILDFIFGKSIRKGIDGFVSVCDDIEKFESGYFSNKKEKKFITIGNGIYPEKFTTRKHLIFDQNNLNILFVGAGYRTNGLHRLIYSMNEYYQKKLNNEVNIHVHVVGDSDEMNFNKLLVKNFELDKHFTFHGFLAFKNYEYLYNECHIAMGTLSFSRIKTYTASILKVREYCSIGIPFFYAYDDPDFDNDFKYHLKVPANDLAFELQPIFDFAVQNNAQTQLPEEMHMHALNHLHWNIKMKKIYEFILNI